jgi:DNA-binding CsgD family transcriptional regulator
MNELDAKFHDLTRIVTLYCKYRLDLQRGSTRNNHRATRITDGSILDESVTVIRSLLPRLSNKVGSVFPSSIFVDRILDIGVARFNDRLLTLIWEQYYKFQTTVRDIADLSNYSPRSVQRRIDLFPGIIANELWKINDEFSNPETTFFVPISKRQRALEILKQEFSLTEKEINIVLAYNWSRPYVGRKVVADRLKISINTLKTHHRSICRKLHSTSINEAISKAQRLLQEHGIEKISESLSDTPKDFAGRSNEGRNLIEAVKTPLGFFSLVMFVVIEPLIGMLLATNPAVDRKILHYGVVGIPLLSILLVGSMAIWKPEALWGKKYANLDDAFAKGLGEDIHTALETYFTTLEKNGRLAAYRLLRRTLISSPHSQLKNVQRLREIIAETIIRRAELQDKWRNTKNDTRPKASRGHDQSPQEEKKDVDR